LEFGISGGTQIKIENFKEAQRMQQSSLPIMLGVIGDPIAHSLSPLLHGYFIREHGLPAAYHAFRVRPADLGAAIAGARALGFRGLNVTLPHKQAVMAHLDAIEPVAQQVGAVNMVIFKADRTIGTNTDVPGLLRSLQQAGVQLQGQAVFIIGAGGAARAAAFAARSAGARALHIANRTAEKAVGLAREVGAEAAALDAVQQLPPGAVVIQATPVGMHPAVDACVLPASRFRGDLVYVDLVYNPLETKFLRLARQAGAKTVDGLGMLIHQGILSLERWLGVSLAEAADVAGVRAELVARMGKGAAE